MSEPTREAIDAAAGTTVLEFGASWCGYCQGARKIIDRAVGEQADARHLWIEDGKGKRLGRSFGVTLWPTLIVVRDGVEIGRVVRPHNEDAVRAAFETSQPSAASSR